MMIYIILNNNNNKKACLPFHNEDAGEGKTESITAAAFNPHAAARAFTHIWKITTAALGHVTLRGNLQVVYR